MASFEREAYAAGFRRIAGIDEVGRGPLAGPVVAAAVVLEPEYDLKGVRDSKELSGRQREKLFEKIQDEAVDIGIGVVEAGLIDRINILQATILAMEEAIKALRVFPDYLLIDALSLPRVLLPQKALIKGDTLSVSIAASSIIAKVTRDRMMCEYHERYPHYNFLSHKGYPTEEHRQALVRFGPCDIHRKTFQWKRPACL